jgi:hypothetical protein
MRLSIMTTHINFRFQPSRASCTVRPRISSLSYKCVGISAVETTPNELAKQESAVGYMQKHAWYSCIVEQEYVIECS